jgi:hypothetical protein
VAGQSSPRRRPTWLCISAPRLARSGTDEPVSEIVPNTQPTPKPSISLGILQILVRDGFSQPTCSNLLFLLGISPIHAATIVRVTFSIVISSDIATALAANSGKPRLTVAKTLNP